MHNQNEEVFMTKKKKPSFAEWTLQNGITQKPASTNVGVGVPDDPHSRTNQQVTVKTTTTKPQTRDPFLEGFYSTDDKPETERKTYLQHRTPAVDRVSPETKKPQPIKLPYRPSVQGPPKMTKLPYIPAQDGPPKMTQYGKQTASAYDSPVKIVGDNVTKKDYDDFWNAFHEESTGEKLNWATEQGRNLVKPQNQEKQNPVISREDTEKIIDILDAITAKTRDIKRKNWLSNEMVKYSMNPIGYPVEAVLKNLHYSRNLFNESAPKTISEAEDMGWVQEDADYCHQNGVAGRTNVKYIPSDGGHGEQIFIDSNTVDTSPENMATPNVFDPNEHPKLHGLFDVAPWVLWGNRWDDPTSILERIVVPLVYQYYEENYDPSRGDSIDISDL